MPKVLYQPKGVFGKCNRCNCIYDFSDDTDLFSLDVLNAFQWKDGRTTGDCSYFRCTKCKARVRYFVETSDIEMELSTIRPITKRVCVYCGSEVWKTGECTGCGASESVVIDELRTAIVNGG